MWGVQRRPYDRYVLVTTKVLALKHSLVMWVDWVRLIVLNTYMNCTGASKSFEEIDVICQSSINNTPM